MDEQVNTAVSEIGAILSRLTFAQSKEAMEEVWKWYIGGPRPTADEPVIVEEKS